MEEMHRGKGLGKGAWSFHALSERKSLSHVWLFATPWNRGPPSMEFSRPRVLEWDAISFSRGSSLPRDRTQVSCIAGRCFTIWATREAPRWKRCIEVKVWGKGHGASMPSLRGLHVFICLCSCVHQPGNSPNRILLTFYEGFIHCKAWLIKSLAIGDWVQSPTPVLFLGVGGWD